MKTKIHTYAFNLNDVTQREPYHQLKARLSAEVKAGTRGHCLNVFERPGEESRKHRLMIRAAESAGTLTLETDCLFSNQWNSVEAGRVFDWYEGINHDNRLLKFGHYLEITPAMVAIRRETLKCGYTGQQFPASAGMRFNTTAQALGSPYLKEEQLHLLRLLPVCDTDKTRTKLSDAEREELLPLYLAAQTKLRGELREKQRAEVIAEFEKDSANARTEYEGKLWLLDHGVSLENCIFYNHTGRFSFGWRTPYGAKAAQAMRDALAGFPFAFDIQEGGK